MSSFYKLCLAFELTHEFVKDSYKIILNLTHFFLNIYFKSLYFPSKIKTKFKIQVFYNVS